MTLENLLEKATSEQISVADLTTIASSRTAFGDDVVSAFGAQAELRTRAAQAIIAGAESAQRDLLASEARDCDRLTRERDSILGLVRHVEQRTATSYAPPQTQRIESAPETADVSPVLGREQRVSEYLTRRGGARYAGEPGADRVRFGSIIRALALGRRDGLTTVEQRALSEGTDSAGGYTVPEIVGAQFIDRVRNAMVTMRAGAMTVPMTSDVLHLARLADAYTDGSPAARPAMWKTENASIEETEMLLERVTFTARTLPMLIKLSVELSDDSQNIDNIIETEMARSMAVELDRVALIGSGTAPEPRGIVNQSGVTTTDFGGAAVSDYDFIIDSIARLWAANHTPNARVYAPGLAAGLAKLKDSTGQPLRVPDVVAAVPAFVTNQVEENAGSSPTDTTMIVGDFTQLLIGMRTSFRLEVSRVAGEAFEKLQIAVRAYLRADVQLAHAAAFDVVVNIG